MTPAGKLRVLYVIDNERFGGGERAFALLMNGLDKSRFEVFAACLTGTPGSRRFADAVSAGAVVLHFDLRRLVSFSAAPILRRLVRDNAIDIVHSQGARADFYCRLALRGGGATLISTVAAPVEEYDIGPLRKLVYAGFDRLFSSSVDGYIAVAGHIKRKLVERRGIAPRRIEVIRNGIPLWTAEPPPAEISALRAKLGIPSGCVLASSFCRLVPEKGLFILIDAAAECARRGAAIRFLLAGEGPLEAELRARVSALGLEKNFIFAGFVRDVRPALYASDLVLMPSLREGFPMSLLEAMAAARPIIASDIEGIDEAVADGDTAKLVPPGDPAALADAVMELIHDRVGAAEMGRRAGAAAADKFGLRKAVIAHEKLYAERLLPGPDLVSAASVRAPAPGAEQRDGDRSAQEAHLLHGIGRYPVDEDPVFSA